MTPTPTPTPAPAGVRYTASGLITDETGAPVPGARVEIGFVPLPGIVNHWVAATSDAAGHYEVSFEALRLLGNVPGAVARFIASLDGYDFNVQYLPGGNATIARSAVIRRARSITTGESATVTVDANSSVCSDLEDALTFDRQCGQIHVVVSANGTLVVEARPVQDASAVPLVFSATSGFYRGQVYGPGTVTLGEVVAGKSYHIFVGSPKGMVSQQYVVTASLQAPAAGGQR